MAVEVVLVDEVDGVLAEELDSVGTKVAVRVVFPSTTRAQFWVPVHAPLHPANVKPVAGVALTARLVPAAIEALQVFPQSIPPGLEATVPLPVPFLTTVTV